MKTCNRSQTREIMQSVQSAGKHVTGAKREKIWNRYSVNKGTSFVITEFTLEVYWSIESKEAYKVHINYFVSQLRATVFNGPFLNYHVGRFLNILRI